MSALMSLVRALLLLSYAVQSAVSINVDDFFKEFKTNEWVVLENRFSEGSMKGFFTYQEMKALVNTAKKEYPQFVLDIRSIGKTIEERDILAIALGKSVGSGAPNLQKSSIVFTGLHHAREPLSISANLFILFKLLHQAVNGNQTTLRVLENNILWFIPIINVDGYEFIHNKFKTTNILDDLIRKNRRDVGCSLQNQGVDLNRNYGFKFAFEDIEGSSNDKCSEQYRGEYAFSEPETQAIKNFLVERRNIVKTVLNFHAYGNLWIEPYNFEKDPDNKRLLKNTTVYNLYEEFHNEAKFRGTYKFGNAPKTIDYIANGEASDWIMGELGIFVLSPELGLGDVKSERFYPEASYISNILVSNYETIEYMIYRFDFIPRLDYCVVYNQNETWSLFKDGKWNQKLANLNKTSRFLLFSCQIFNKGVSDISSPLKFELNAHQGNKELLNSSLTVSGSFLHTMTEEYWLNKKSGAPLPESRYNSSDEFVGERLELDSSKNESSPGLYTVENIHWKGRSFYRLSFILSVLKVDGAIPDQGEVSLKFSQIDGGINSGEKLLRWDNIGKEPSSPQNPQNETQKPSFLIIPMIFVMIFVGFLLCLIFVYQFWKRKKKDEEKHLLRMREVDSSNIDIEMISEGREPTSGRNQESKM